jgi:hypothetical protein
MYNACAFLTSDAVATAAAAAAFQMCPLGVNQQAGFKWSCGQTLRPKLQRTSGRCAQESSGENFTVRLENGSLWCELCGRQGLTQFDHV